MSDIIPRVPRCTLQERIQHLALEAPPRSRPTLDAQPTRPWLSGDRTLSGLDLETSKRMPLPPIHPTPPPPVQTPKAQAWSEREAEAAVVVEEEREGAAAGGAKPRPDSGAFFMTQVLLGGAGRGGAGRGGSVGKSVELSRSKDPPGCLKPGLLRLRSTGQKFVRVFF